ncbi:MULTISPECIES: MerR family transcriptional regulator [Lactiplantibacillus]|jgi:DNA-binding transcriptional MerR regulator|uniref:MerR family transcriptional regulator n=6 Tax=Lactiplantibacillus TaxID=2767842 RepID=A0A2I0Z1C4_LACPE|nr:MULTISPECIES: MerR family transcriptional regulator [Lactiplantibacillus]MCH4130527.1 MerR family transcriptional regulator [Lactiplantibacillus sp.]CCC18030.1 regulatory protein, merR [Lactiplantibacillus pentosus IG1]BBM22765.1 regulatory protein, merR [Lactiplantibacillus plantarum]AUI78099.1 transcriptional regulator [Lactiplantibacillus pentosus]AYG37954.1 MerR family transcriptional regulator [Lactiplantibacillus pentosus]
MNINAVSKQFKVTKDTLRYWERIGILPPIHRNESGYRDYDDNDMNWIYYVKTLRRAGMSIESLIEYMKLLHQDGMTAEARRDLLIEQRTELQEQLNQTKQTIDYLSYKIDHFQDHILRNEAEKLFPESSERILDDVHDA